MDILKLFTHEEPIAGLEVTDSSLRLLLLETAKVKKKKGEEKGGTKEESVVKVKASAEKPLPEGAVVNGEIADDKLFTASLGGLLKEVSGAKGKTAVRYVMVSLPPNFVYSKIFSFPRAVAEEKVEESIKLTIGFSLPVKPEEVYLDWEKTGVAAGCFLAAAPKGVIDGYASALRRAGLSPVAVEFHPLSLARVVNSEEPALVVVGYESGVGFSVVKSGAVMFTRFVPKERIKSPAEEARKVADFYSAGGEKISKIVLVGEKLTSLSDEFEGVGKVELAAPGPFANLIKSGDWLITLGAALRGLLPRSDDNLVSLLPVGTEEAYEHQKAIAFSEFVSNVVVGVSIFFAAAFVGTWLLMSSVQKTLTSQVGRLQAISLPEGDLTLEERATRLNGLTAVLAEQTRRAPRYSLILRKIREEVTSGITLSGLSVSSPEEAISLSGVAQTRDALNQFRRKLEGAEAFTEVNMPLANLDQRENISFSVSLRLKDPSFVYYAP